MTISQPAADPLTARQTEVLDRALALLVEGGERALTTAGIARAANCSKESLYKWFGDRDGLLAAIITHQASKVRVRQTSSSGLSAGEFRARLVAFARDLLAVLASDVSIALNRLAVGQAGHDGAHLGRLLLDNGRRPIEERLSALLSGGHEAGLITYGDPRDASRTLYGLIVRDLHIRLLLGGLADAGETDAAHATRAVDQFLRLHADHGPRSEHPAGRPATTSG